MIQEEDIIVTLNDTEDINTSLGDNADISNIVANEDQRIKNEKERISNEQERIDYYDQFKQDVASGKYNGKDGVIGKDGISPIITTSKSGKVTTLTIVDVEGTKTATILDGEDGSGTGTNDMSKSIYDTNNNGIVDNAEKVNNHTVDIDVPANAIFTDTIYDDTEIKNILQNKADTDNIPIKLSDLVNDSEFITKTTDNLTNYYLKNETYTKSETNDLIKAIITLNIEIVSVLPSSNISTTTIYLVPKLKSKTTDFYDEYIYVNNSWELIGNTEIDLSNCYTKTQTDNLLDLKANKTEIPTKVSELQNDSEFISTETDPIFSSSPAKKITDTDINVWNNKSDFSGDYNDLTNKPSIPSKTSELTNDSNFITSNGDVINEIKNNIGNLNNLETSSKSNLVDAINEANQNGSGGGAGETLPVGSELDFDGSESDIPDGWEEVDNNISITGKPVKTGRIINGQEEYVLLKKITGLPNNNYIDLTNIFFDSSETDETKVKYDDIFITGFDGALYISSSDKFFSNLDFMNPSNKYGTCIYINSGHLYFATNNNYSNYYALVYLKFTYKEV